MNALFRLELPDGSIRLAAGTVDNGPQALLGPDASIDLALAEGGDGLAQLIETAAPAGELPSSYRLRAPVESQEVWAAGVTYERSREARTAESNEPDVYERVYDAERPELFFKAAGWRARGPEESIAVRADSTWDVPEPELALVVAADLTVVALTIGNDVSSRSIEGDNPLYLPQAKVYDGSCAVGPALVLVDDVSQARTIAAEIERDGTVVWKDETSTARLRREADELAEWLGRAMSFPCGAVLLTGTGIVPPDDFSLKAGDVVRISIDGLGTLTNPVDVAPR